MLSITTQLAFVIVTTYIPALPYVEGVTRSVSLVVLLPNGPVQKKVTPGVISDATISILLPRHTGLLLVSTGGAGIGGSRRMIGPTTLYWQPPRTIVILSYLPFTRFGMGNVPADEDTRFEVTLTPPTV
jgi:hypothetical protein